MTLKTKSSLHRLEYLDWVRGLGAVIMLQGHVFDSYLKPELRPGGAFTFSQFLGGMPPAIFLFLTGVTLAFLMDSSERKGMSARERVITALRRSGYLFGLAFAFRAFEFAAGLPVSTGADFLRVDILNCMGFSIAVLSVMAIFRTAERARLCAVLGLAIALLAPVISQIDWSGVPWPIRAYIIPDHRFFGFFPWGAYLAFGVAAGSAIRLIPAGSMDRAMQWAALASAAAIVACQYLAQVPYSIYTASDFWLNSPAQVLTKLSVTVLMLAFAFVWTQYIAKDGWSWVRQFGVTSLLVYWVHIELIYGRWLWFLKDSLTVPQTVVTAILVILFMLLLSTIRTHPAQARAVLANLNARFSPSSQRVSGD
jgi:Heparan-alpha-glucosaminide N-acetyltransferase, catalytic